FKRLPITHAHEFPRLMQAAGVSPLPADRVKLIESQFQTVVPEGTSVRRDSCSLAHVAFEFERPKVFSVPFAEKDCPVTGTLLNFELANGPNWFALQKDNGTFVGSLCSILENRLPQPPEVDLRTKALRRRLQLLAAAFERDQARPLRERVNDLRLIPAVIGGGTRYDQAVRISRRAKALGERLQIAVSEIAIDQTAFFTFCGNTLHLSRLLPSRVVAIVALLASLQDVPAEVRDALQDLGQCGLGTDTLPSTSVGCLIAAGWLLDQILVLPESATPERERRSGELLRLALGRKWNLDLLALTIEPKDAVLPREFWEARLAQSLESVGFAFERHGRLLKNVCLDPTGLAETIKGWPDGGGKEMDLVTVLARKVVARCGTRAQSLPVSLPGSAQEESLDVKLKEAEGIWPGRAKALTDLLWAARADVEACMMDLPPVLEEQDTAWNSRLALLMRFVRLAARLPGVSGLESSKLEVQKHGET
ncbi:MAG TPA: glycine--tRNA ligase subunit beta, partial [Candidatus Ozemobacteraceae bacterium]|nr:glycine--tRNA ligase subunit beta [Candidatus Ozemobacteraceae bacterium]